LNGPEPEELHDMAEIQNYQNNFQPRDSLVFAGWSDRGEIRKIKDTEVRYFEGELRASP